MSSRPISGGHKLEKRVETTVTEGKAKPKSPNSIRTMLSKLPTSSSSVVIIDSSVPGSLSHHTTATTKDQDDQRQLLDANIDHQHQMRSTIVLDRSTDANVMEKKDSVLVYQQNNKAFFSSLSFDKKIELASYPVEEPLHRAILSEELVDVVMILDQFGPDGPAKISSRDKFGRTALHIAALCSSSPIVETLLLGFRRCTIQELNHDLVRLESDRIRILADVKSALKLPFSENKRTRNVGVDESAQSRTKEHRYISIAEFELDVNKVPQIQGVEDWFRNEVIRRRRQAEIRIELWWVQLMATRDCFGRTPLHYLATMQGSSFSVLNAMLSDSKADLFGDNVSKNKRSFNEDSFAALFSNQSVYDSVSAQEIISNDNNKTLVAPRNADSKQSSSSYDRNIIGSTGIASSFSTVRNIAWELGSSLGISVSVPVPEAAGDKSFEVVVPWLLRNVIRRASQKSEFNESRVEALESLVKKMVARPVVTILVPEFSRLLDCLGIRVTREVMHEICRRYPANCDDVLNKWQVVSAQQAEEKKDIEREVVLQEKRIGVLKTQNKDHDETKADFKSDGKCRFGGPPSTGSKYDAKRNNVDVKIECEERQDPKNPTIGKLVFVQKEPKAISERKARLLSMDPLDKDRGVDFFLLLADIKNGRGIQSLDLDSMTVSGGGALVTGIQKMSSDNVESENELKVLVHDSSHSIQGDKGSAVCVSRGADLIQRSTFVSVSIMKKTRQDVINIRDVFGRTALMLAAANGRKDQVACFIKRRGDVSICSNDGHSAITLASDTATRNVIERALVYWLGQRYTGLLENERKLVDINRSTVSKCNDSQGIYEFAKAASRSFVSSSEWEVDTSGRLSQVQLEQRAAVVTALGAQLDQMTCKNWAYGRPSLSWAVRNGLVSVVKQSLAEGVDVTCTDTLCRTVMHECASLISDTSLHCHLEAALEIAEMLLKAGVDVNAASASGRRPMHDLFCHGQDAAASFVKILHKGSSTGDNKSVFRLVTNRNVSASRLLAYRRKFVKTLLDYGADPTLHDRHGLGAIHYCARTNDVGSLLEIIRKRFDLSKAITRSRQSPLHIACKAGAFDAITLLSRWDADTSPKASLHAQVDVQGKTPAQLLPPTSSLALLDTIWGKARMGQLRRVSEILSKVMFPDQTQMLDNNLLGCSIDNSGGSPCRNECDDSYTELWLLNDVDAKTRRMRWTALHACVVGWAEREAVFGHRGKANLCARRATRLGMTSKTTSEASSLCYHSSPLRDLSTAVAATAIAVAGQSREEQFPETLLLLLRNCAFVDSVDISCRTPLMIAAAANLTQAVDILLKAGADVNARDIDGRTALHLANCFGSVSASSLLEANGADPEIKDGRGKRPFEVAGQASGIALLPQIYKSSV